jgi:uncharacterized membrane protein
MAIDSAPAVKNVERANTLTPAPPKQTRLDSIDLVRGLIIVIMALDHVRDFFSERIHEDPTDLTKTTAAIFLTRWITHYCAPNFMFLAGSGAFLYGNRGRTKGQLSWFLFSRGVWLIFLEITVIRLSWGFDFNLHHWNTGIFWPIGCCMIALSALVLLPTSAIAAFGVVMIAYHNLLDGVTAAQVHELLSRATGGWIHLPEEWSKGLWSILHGPGEVLLWRDVAINGVTDNLTFSNGYRLIPWIGIIAAGYAFGAFYLLEPHKRRKELLGLGLALTAAFVVLRGANVYGDPNPRAVQERPGFTALSFLNCTKYPPSLAYNLMTIGPAIALLGVFEGVRGKWAQPLIVFGRVPLFFYLLHIPLIHGGIVLLDYLRYGWSPQANSGPWFDKSLDPPDYGVSLPTVYLLWVAVLLILYFPCAWFAEVKRRYRWAWLSYF